MFEGSRYLRGLVSMESADRYIQSLEDNMLMFEAGRDAERLRATFWRRTAFLLAITIGVMLWV